MAMATAIATNQLGVMKSVRKSDGRSASERWRAKRGKDCLCCVLKSRTIELKPKKREALAHPIVGMVCQGLLKTIALGTCALRYISWHKDCLTPVTGDPLDGALASGVVSKKGSEFGFGRALEKKKRKEKEKDKREVKEDFHKMNTKMKLVLGVVLLCLPVGLQADAGFIALEGSDATALHHDAQYTPQLFKYLQGSSSLPVLVYNNGGFVIDLSGISGGVATVNTITLVGQNLSDYSAIYIESPGGCCTALNTALDGFGAAVNAFIAAGGNLSIENYIGGGYDGVVVGGSGTPAGAIEGYTALNGGVGGGPICTDGELVTALGISKGFTQPPVDGCWSHQAYESSYWEPLGYVSLMASATDASSGFGFTFGDGTQKGSSFLALGGTLGAPPAVPEPSTVVLLGGALVVLVAGKRRFASR